MQTTVADGSNSVQAGLGWLIALLALISGTLAALIAWGLLAFFAADLLLRGFAPLQGAIGLAILVTEVTTVGTITWTQRRRIGHDPGTLAAALWICVVVDLTLAVLYPAAL